MERLILLLVAILVSQFAFSTSHSHVSGIPTTLFPEIGAYDVLKNHSGEQKGVEAPQFALARSVRISPLQLKQGWEQLDDQTLVWRHRFQAPRAHSLNFAFTDFYLPSSAKISFTSAYGKSLIRDIDHQDNNYNNEFWTPIIPSDVVILELRINKSEMSKLRLELTQVGQAYRPFGSTYQEQLSSSGTPRTNSAGACNRDVACDEARTWQAEVNSVGVISTGGTRFCTGFMVNNAREDKTPYFITANHCRIRRANAASLVVYWNYQRSTCAGRGERGSLTQWQSGALFLASNSNSDFTIVKLNNQPDQNWNVTYAGWDRRPIEATQTTAIHHPRTAEKSISFSYQQTTFTRAFQNDEVSHEETGYLKVHSWDTGTTEPGSSGSPLFNQDHRVIGQLYGGQAACGNNSPDWYGSFHHSWDKGFNDENNLKPYLDPDDTGIEYIDTLI